MPRAPTSLKTRKAARIHRSLRASPEASSTPARTRNTSKRISPWATKIPSTLEGEFHRWDIGTREGTSEIKVSHNFQNALKNAGFTIDYAGWPSQLVAHKGATWIFIDNRGTYYYQTIITTKEMKQEVTDEASSPSDEVNKSGHVAVTAFTLIPGKPRFCLIREIFSAKSRSCCSRMGIETQSGRTYEQPGKCRRQPGVIGTPSAGGGRVATAHGVEAA